MIAAFLDQLLASQQDQIFDLDRGLPRRGPRPPRQILQPLNAPVTKPAPILVKRFPADLIVPTKLGHILNLTGQCRSHANIHRRHLLGHEPCWSQPYSGVSDVPRHRTVSDVPEQHSSLSGGFRAELQACG